MEYYVWVTSGAIRWDYQPPGVFHAFGDKGKTKFFISDGFSA